MTNQEAITIIGNLEDKDILYNPCDVQDAKTMAIKALEQEPCEDAISREAVLDLAKKGVLVSNGNYKSVCKAINELPSVNPQEPKTGHWIGIDEEPHEDYECDKCGNIITTWNEPTLDYKYCFKCGAKMVEQESDHKCHTCKHYTSGENDGSCGSYICKGYSDWESEDKE